MVCFKHALENLLVHSYSLPSGLVALQSAQRCTIYTSLILFIQTSLLCYWASARMSISSTDPSYLEDREHYCP